MTHLISDCLMVNKTHTWKKSVNNKKPYPKMKYVNNIHKIGINIHHLTAE